MFGGTKLETFTGDLSSLKEGLAMFQYASGLTVFDAPLSSLTEDCWAMFTGCKLDLPSVQTIAHTIKDNSSMAAAPTLTLGMAKALRGQVDVELELIRQKGWALTAQYN